MKSNIVLIGMPGSGKSTIGVQLAKWLGYDFVDSDLIIQKTVGKTLSEIITDEGDAGFLRIENEINQTINPKRSIIATGGSAVYGEEAMKHFKEIGDIVYLKVNLSDLEARLGDLFKRGVVSNGKKDVSEILEDRVRLYEKYSEISLDLSGMTPSKAAEVVFNQFKDRKEKQGRLAMEVEEKSKNFIEQIIDRDLAEGHVQEVHTRFPPEPNGYLHIGHAKAILLSYGIAKEYGGKFNLRFDDTNPGKEKEEFVESIKDDVKWLGVKWDGDIYFASDYFEKMYEAAVTLIKKGKAFVCDLTAEEIRDYRGTLTEPGKESPYRNRSVEENLKLFEDMKNGVYGDGEKVLRAKIDMSSPNINMRDPVIYRVARLNHHRTGDKWCVYPMYDFAHPLEDAFEGITHSLCTLEFEDHRPLYNWVVEEVGFENPPQQIEFAKLYLKNVVTGKRYIKKLVEDGIVDGWNDPRLVSISGLRRRGFTPESIAKFVELVGVTKSQGEVEYPMLEYCIREDLKLSTKRIMAVLDPVKVVIDNYPEGQEEMLEVPNNMENPVLGTRLVPFSRELFIEREDFMENPPKKYFRLFPGNEVRLMNAYFVKCTSLEKDENGEIKVIHCEYDPETKGGDSKERKVKGTIHWVAAKSAKSAKVRIYENLVNEEKEMYAEDGSLNVNPNSLTTIENALFEPYIKEINPEERFQFVRNGYFVSDLQDSEPGKPVFNRIVSLKSSFKLS